jgi:hypothetical protein
MGASNIVWVLRGLFVAVVVVTVWWAKGRVDKSYALERQVAEYDARIEFENKADKDRIVMEIKDAKTKETIRTVIKVVTRDVVRILPSKPECALGPDVTLLLNRARGYEVPTSAVQPHDETGAVAKTP